MHQRAERFFVFERLGLSCSFYGEPKGKYGDNSDERLMLQADVYEAKWNVDENIA